MLITIFYIQMLHYTTHPLFHQTKQPLSIWISPFGFCTWSLVHDRRCQDLPLVIQSINRTAFWQFCTSRLQFHKLEGRHYRSICKWDAHRNQEHINPQRSNSTYKPKMLASLTKKRQHSQAFFEVMTLLSPDRCPLDPCSGETSSWSDALFFFLSSLSSKSKFCKLPGATKLPFLVGFWPFSTSYPFLKSPYPLW